MNLQIADYQDYLNHTKNKNHARVFGNCMAILNDINDNFMQSMYERGKELNALEQCSACLSTDLTTQVYDVCTITICNTCGLEE
jgi:hypothetical protein